MQEVFTNSPLFIDKGFNTVMAPITDRLKKGEFTLSSVASKEFVKIKKRMVSAPITRFPDF